MCIRDRMEYMQVLEFPSGLHESLAPAYIPSLKSTSFNLALDIFTFELELGISIVILPKFAEKLSTHTGLESL